MYLAMHIFQSSNFSISPGIIELHLIVLEHCISGFE